MKTLIRGDIAASEILLNVLLKDGTTECVAQSFDPLTAAALIKILLVQMRRDPNCARREQGAIKAQKRVLDLVNDWLDAGGYEEYLTEGSHAG